MPPALVAPLFLLLPVTRQNASDLVGKMRILKKLSFSIEISVRQYWSTTTSD